MKELHTLDHDFHPTGETVRFNVDTIYKCSRCTAKYTRSYLLRDDPIPCKEIQQIDRQHDPSFNVANIEPAEQS